MTPFHENMTAEPIEPQRRKGRKAFFGFFLIGVIEQEKGQAL
jgi:hypothetical protein